VHWFTQNYDGTAGASKISPLPIGIDFHMLAQNPAWGENISTPRQQEQILRLVRDALPKLPDRLPKVYLDFAWQKGWGLRSFRRFHPLHGTSFRESRRKVAKIMRGNQSVVAQPGPLSRTAMWQARGAYAFVLSPHGVGLDCHRTWEALALGHIVLVPSSSLDDMFEGLPVIPLKSWADLTPENLCKWHSHFSTLHVAGEKLTSRYWIDKMRAEFLTPAGGDTNPKTRA
jgi:hypothetical protein